MTPIIQIPTLNDGLRDFQQLLYIYQQITNSGEDRTILDLSNCNFLRDNAVAFLGGIVRFNQNRGKIVTIDWDTCSSAITTNLQQNGFHGIFTNKSQKWNGNSIPYREDLTQDSDAFVAYLSECWLGRGWIDIGTELKNEVITRICELYGNAFEHAESEVGVFTCGQLYPNLCELNLTIVDFGVGIPLRVRTHIGNPTMPATEAIEWAIKRGNSTRLDNVPKGTGLDALTSFVTQYAGQMQVISHNGYVLFTRDGVSCMQCSSSFEGTLINIKLKCDESRYYKKPHRPNKPWF